MCIAPGLSGRSDPVAQSEDFGHRNRDRRQIKIPRVGGADENQAGESTGGLVSGPPETIACRDGQRERHGSGRTGLRRGCSDTHSGWAEAGGTAGGQQPRRSSEAGRKQVVPRAHPGGTGRRRDERPSAARNEIRIHARRLFPPACRTGRRPMKSPGHPEDKGEPGSDPEGPQQDRNAHRLRLAGTGGGPAGVGEKRWQGVPTAERSGGHWRCRRHGRSRR
jgi:hypothetical protein